MQPNAYSRPDDRELLRASLRQLSGTFRPAVLFAGLANGELLQLTDFLGTATSSLHQVVVVPGAGLGGRVYTQRRPSLVKDYVASEGITHEYDLAVRREQLSSMAAVPVVIRGKSRAVLYIARRDSSPLGENAVRVAMDASAGLDGEWPLFLDVWLEHTVEDVNSQDRPGTKGTIEGPYYVPGSPELHTPATVEMRDDEEGIPSRFTGRFTDTEGNAIQGAQVEIWHADSAGFYSQYAPGLPE